MKNLTDIRYVKSLLSRHGFHFSKKLGQNFLIDPSVCPQIAEMGNAKAGQGILEIGPGIGTLTQQLAMRAERVTAVELDSRLFPILEETVGEFQNLHILSGDILKFSVPELLEQEFPGMPVSVCANLPYYITTPILMHLLESGADIETITVMVQKEVAEKLQAPVGSREAGAITVAVNFYGSVELLFPVQRDKNGFSQRRKTLVNVLSSTMHYEKSMLTQILAEMQLPETVRIEKLTMEQLITLSNHLAKIHPDAQQ